MHVKEQYVKPLHKPRGSKNLIVMNFGSSGCSTGARGRL